MKKVLSVLVLLLVCAVTYAGGYRVSLQGQRALAMGHTGVAVVNSAELAFFNPAGLIHLENKLNISVGGFGVFSDVAYQNTQFGTSAQTESPVGTPVYLYASYKVSEKFALGLAVYTPYGSTVEYPTDWAGSHLVNSIELASIYVQPLFSWEVVEGRFSIGGGPILAIGSVNFNRNLNRNLTDLEGNRSNVTIDASGITEFGYSVGAMLNLDDEDKWKLGVNYRSQIDVQVEPGDGEATFSNVPESPLAPITNGEFDFTASLPLPAEWTIGFSYKPNDEWLFAFDYNYAEWSAYNSLDLEFLNTDGTVALESINPRNYKDASTYRFGIQHSPIDKLDIRVGYYFDESPVQDGFFAPETPRNDSNGFTAGLSFNVSEKLAIDASFLYLNFEEVDASYDAFLESDGTPAPFAGTYKSSAVVAGLGLSYKL
jgi:long-chain fatty acid transport protein